MAAPTPTPLLPAPPRKLVPIQPRLLDASGSDGFNASAVQAQARAATAAKDAQRRRHRLAVQRSYYAKLERDLIHVSEMDRPPTDLDCSDMCRNASVHCESRSAR
jgi:hypothetical protein